MSKRYIAWARVSSVRQKEEGWSLEQQEQRLREYADRNGGTIAKMYVVTETASKRQERKTFQDMLRYARDNAGKLDGLLVMKIDRAARNMWDFMALEELEEKHGVKLVSVTQPTESTPSGKMMRRTFATFATFFTEQLSADVKQAMKRRAEAGLFVTLAPYGYRNVRRDKRRLVEVHPDEARAVKRIFHLYAVEGHTLDSLMEALAAEHITYRPNRPAWTRSKLYELLTDRSYIGEVDHLGVWYPGTHQPLIDRQVFDRVQELLGRKTYRSHEMLFAGSLIACGHCGRPISGERKIKKLNDGGERVHVYYRCARYNAPQHPRVRLPEGEIEGQLLGHFDRLVVPDYVGFAWREVLSWRVEDENAVLEADRRRLSADAARLAGQRDALLNLRLNGEVDEQTFAAKQQELRDREAQARAALEKVNASPSMLADLSSRAFELSQSLRSLWVTLARAAKRRLLELVCLNLRLDGASLVVEMRWPFAVLSEGPIPVISAKDRTPLDQVQRFVAGVAQMPEPIRLLLVDFTTGKTAVQPAHLTGESHG